MNNNEINNLVSLLDSKPAKILSNPRQYVPTWFKQKGLSVDGRGRLKDQSKNLSDIYDTLYLDLMEQVNAYNNAMESEGVKGNRLIKGVNLKMLEAAFREYMVSEGMRVKKADQDILMFCQPSGEVLDNSELLRFVTAITGTADITAATVLAHWIWGVKNKLKSKIITYHIMPVIYSKVQESGKTTAIHKLTDVLKTYKYDGDLASLVDSRSFAGVASCAIGVFDEMHGAARAEIDGLKRIITANSLSARQLGTNHINDYFQGCSFIGTSNNAISEIIVDSGMRRFFQINAQDKIDWENINSIDYIKLWQSVDENRINGYMLEQREAIKTEQAKLAHEEPINIFLRDLEITPSITEVIFSKELYELYTQHCVDNGFRPLNSTWLGVKLATKGFEKFSKVNPKTGRYARGYYMKVGAK